MFQHRKQRKFFFQAGGFVRFNGAGVFQHRKRASVSRVLHLARHASMEPVCFNTGNDVSTDRICFRFIASMEPVCFNTGNKCARRKRRVAGRCFNGAGVFQHRKQMGCLTRGNPSLCFNGAGVFQHRKPLPIPLKRKQLTRFNGAGVFQHRKPLFHVHLTKPQLKLQWSRCVSTPETR